MEPFSLAKAFDTILYIATGIIAFVLKTYADKIRTLESGLTSLNISLSESYVKKSDMKEFKEEVLDILNRIDSKLDRKQDK